MSGGGSLRRGGTCRLAHCASVAGPIAASSTPAATTRPATTACRRSRRGPATGSVTAGSERDQRGDSVAEVREHPSLDPPADGGFVSHREEWARGESQVAPPRACPASLAPGAAASSAPIHGQSNFGEEERGCANCGPHAGQSSSGGECAVSAEHVQRQVLHPIDRNRSFAPVQRLFPTCVGDLINRTPQNSPCCPLGTHRFAP